MVQTKVLGQAELETLLQNFPSGRPLNFATPAAPGGFSLVAALSNLFEKLGFSEKTPDWVRHKCESVQQEKQTDGSISGTTKFWTPNGYIDALNKGSLIRAKSKEGGTRIALLLDTRSDQPPRGWLIAAWDGKTGQPCPFPI